MHPTSLSHNIAGRNCGLLFPRPVASPINRHVPINRHHHESVPPILPFLMFGIWSLLGLAELVLWILLVVKAYQHEMFKLPIVGDVAEKQADA